MSFRKSIPSHVLPLAVLSVLLVVSGCGKKSDPAEAHGKDVKGETVLVSLQTVPRMVAATGSVQADKTIMVSTRMMGWVRRIHVVEGQSVDRKSVV